MADLKELLGDAFREDMTLADIEAALSDKKLADLSTGKYTNAEKYAAAEKKAKEAEEKAKELEKKLKDKMTEEEKAAEALKEAEEQRLLEEQARQEAINKLRKENCRLLMESEFSKSGITEEQYGRLTGAYETDDPAKAVEFAKGISALIAEERKNAELKAKAEAMAVMTPPGGGTGGDNKKLSLDEIMLRANQGEDINELMKFLSD